MENCKIILQIILQITFLCIYNCFNTKLMISRQRWQTGKVSDFAEQQTKAFVRTINHSLCHLFICPLMTVSSVILQAFENHQVTVTIPHHQLRLSR